MSIFLRSGEIFWKIAPKHEKRNQNGIFIAHIIDISSMTVNMSIYFLSKSRGEHRNKTVISCKKTMLV